MVQETVETRNGRRIEKGVEKEMGMKMEMKTEMKKKMKKQVERWCKERWRQGMGEDWERGGRGVMVREDGERGGNGGRGGDGTGDGHRSRRVLGHSGGRRPANRKAGCPPAKFGGVTDRGFTFPHHHGLASARISSIAHPPHPPHPPPPLPPHLAVDEEEIRKELTRD